MVSALCLYALPVWQLLEVVRVLFGEFILEALQVKEKEKEKEKEKKTKMRKRREWIMRDYV